MFFDKNLTKKHTFPKKFDAHCLLPSTYFLYYTQPVVGMRIAQGPGLFGKATDEKVLAARARGKRNRSGECPSGGSPSMQQPPVSGGVHALLV